MDLVANQSQYEESSRRRIEARAQIAEKMRQRQSQRKKGRENPAVKNPVLPPLCSYLRHSWDEAMKSLFAFSTRQSPSIQQRKQQNAKRASAFPSILNILQEHALKDQMELFDLSLLPSDYDFQRAIHDMSESRSRVFLLLDLAAIVQTHVYWRKRLPKKVRMIYRTNHNRSDKLLKVLGRLGVGLQVSTKYDVQLCQESCGDNARLFDDSTCVSKNNSYYRRLILDSPPSVASSTPLVVDGPEEVRRLVDTIKNMAKRRNQKIPRLQFVLKIEHLKDEWRETIEDTIIAAQVTGHYLVGYSLAIPGNESDLSLFLSGLSEAIVYWSQLGMASPELHLTNPNSFVDSKLVDWLAGNSDLLSLVTLDMSHLLVENAGALCTRIIGVKQNEPGKIHYYIDDGCYGSLSNHSKDSRPLPLINGMSVCTDSDQMQQQELVATVWGPTCDGLDKVCSDILLPKLCRDDWLVFGNAGFCNVGTSFNGFAPPDVAYCVLGRFLYSPKKSSDL